MEADCMSKLKTKMNNLLVGCLWTDYIKYKTSLQIEMRSVE